MQDDRGGLLNLTAAEIRAIDSKLLSDAEKASLIEKLYGKPNEWTWKRDLLNAISSANRWRNLIGGSPFSAEVFSISHREILLRARLAEPHRPRHTVSDFCDWIYRLYVPKQDYSQLEVGRTAEREIARRFVTVPTHERWKVIHCGMHPEIAAPKTISALSHNGREFSGSPDLVLREKSTGRLLIIEIKVTQAAIPKRGWPNIAAQLWAYSQIDEYQAAPSILLTAEIWRHLPQLRPVAWLAFDSRDIAFQRENRELFDAYTAAALA